MNKHAILHIPMSEYAYGVNDEKVVFRLRSARNDLSSCVLYYGDRACRKNPVDFFPVQMNKIAFSTEFDWFEAIFACPFKRLCYYFELTDSEGKSILYYGNCFEKTPSSARSEFFQLPYNHRADRVKIPYWAEDAIVYNIFPDSFATGKRFVSGIPTEFDYNETKCRGMLGGTINGVKDNLDYIQELGFNCVYLNPIFVAGEYHKYDLLDYYHIDPVFGTDEDFANLVKEIHKRKMRVIIDGVFNHCGWYFFAFEDVKKYGKNSEYWSWFHRLEEPVTVPDNWDDYPTYECFAYERMMPKLATDNPEVQEYFCNVGKYWIQKFDIDGWRLDVASEVCDSFWIKFRKEIKSVKEDCLLIGEVWESAYHWLDGKMFDSTMNYDFRRHLYRYFAYEDIDTEEFNSRVSDMLIRYRHQIVYGQLNLLDSHDVSRFLTLCSENENKMALAVVFQMTFVGMPCVFYGDELGVSGEIERDYRRPMPWNKEPGFLYNLYKELIQLRNKEKALRNGTFIAHPISDDGVYFYSRILPESKIDIVLNRTAKTYEKEFGTVICQRGYKDGTLSPYGFVIFKD